MKLRLRSIQQWGIILALFFAISIKTDAQTWRLFKKNDGIDCKYFTTDNLCDIYIITNKNEIIKFDDLGYFEGRYANKKMGNLASVDATNPFKILLFYPDFQTITLLDRLLNPISSLVLSDYGIRQAKCVSMSENGNILVFDDATLKFYNFFIDGNGIVHDKTVAISLPNLNPLQIVARNNSIYVLDERMGIVRFDAFGKFLERLDISNVTGFQILNDDIVVAQNEGLFNLATGTREPKPINLPTQESFKQYKRLEKDRLFVQRGTSVDVYKHD